MPMDNKTHYINHLGRKIPCKKLNNSNNETIKNINNYPRVCVDKPRQGLQNEKLENSYEKQLNALNKENKEQKLEINKLKILFSKLENSYEKQLNALSKELKLLINENNTTYNDINNITEDIVDTEDIIINKKKSSNKDYKKHKICQHDKRISRCKECGGSELCKSDWCDKKKHAKYDNYCLFCYVNNNPDANISKNHKTKEKHIADRIIQEFPHFSWITDKKIIDGCSRRRPDMMLDMGSHVIIIEIDEYQHKAYDCSCENKRIMEISQDLNFRAVVFIRFNPDDYIDNNGIKIKSPWRINKTTGLFMIDPNKFTDWNSRINSLIEQIKYWTVYNSDKMIEIIQLYF